MTKPPKIPKITRNIGYLRVKDGVFLMKTALKTCDFLVVGAGIIGLSVARALKRKYEDAVIRVIDKESELGAHASGRNSGVLHAGFYYSSQSLKARLCQQGNKALRDFCKDKGLKINCCGKLVVAKTEEEIEILNELHKRGKLNGVDVQIINEQEAKEIEPRVKTLKKALWSPTTATVDPKEVLNAIKNDIESQGVFCELGTKYISRKKRIVKTSRGEFDAKYVVNAAGLYADHIARQYGYAKEYRMLPFKGLYLYSDEAPFSPTSLRTNIYPVPFLKNPFLGVHFTKTVDGHTKIGPTAIPALWMEQYSLFERFNLIEAAGVCWRELMLLFKSDFAFKELAWEELKKHSKRKLVSLAQELANGIELAQFKNWGHPGIRAQLIHCKTKTLEMDFILEGDEDSFHILNAVSPAFTCSIPFGEYVVEKIDRFL